MRVGDGIVDAVRNPEFAASGRSGGNEVQQIAGNGQEVRGGRIRASCVDVLEKRGAGLSSVGSPELVAVHAVIGAEIAKALEGDRRLKFVNRFLGELPAAGALGGIVRRGR